jgi:hypothetical protein
MNDDELMTTVRESFTTVRSGTPVERIVSRSRAVRARRTIPGAAAVVAVAAGVAVAVATLVPGGPRTAGHPAAGAQLAAWTVVKQADGSVAVTIRELHDPAALQARLRADGVPASVIAGGQPNPCQAYPRGSGSPLLPQMVTVERGTNDSVFLVHPSAIPQGAGVQFAASFASQHGHGAWGITIDPVSASQQCTGSAAG